MSPTGTAGETSATLLSLVISDLPAKLLISVGSTTNILLWLGLPFPNFLKLLSIFSLIISWCSPIVPAGDDGLSDSSGYSLIGCSLGRSWCKWSLSCTENSAVTLMPVTSSPLSGRTRWMGCSTRSCWGTLLRAMAWPSSEWAPLKFA